MKKANVLILVSAVLLALATTVPAWANNVAAENVSITEQDTASNYTHIKFDISWDNSWRTSLAPNNWDAAWVFAKWKLTSGTDWAHCTLSATDVDHTAPTGSTIDAASNGTGIFIYRDADGTGSVDWDNAKLRWNYGTDGVADEATVDVRVFAVEMVYLPAGTLYLNSTASGNMTNEFTDAGITTIASEAELAGEAIKWTVETVYGGQGNSDLLIAAYPKGYGAFYCMKYEISQGQYADFLNTLTATQDGNRFPNQNGNYRHTIGGSAGSRSASRPYRACNYLSWMDGCAYADWAGLRPMTELEFEKACRGDQAVVTDEFAWANVTITAAVTISGAEDGTETITTAGANCCYNNQTFTGGDGGTGPLRCGIFATGASTRVTAGAGYYGMMELSGNLWERCVTVADLDNNGDATNAGAFDGAQGDGALSTDGYADISTWPGYVTSEVTGARGAGFRGGYWYSAASYDRVSDRYYAGYTNTHRYYYYGFRCVRSAP